MESYDSLDRLLDGRVTDNDVLVDIGCGKGRVINWVLHNLHCRRVYGIELDPEIAKATARRLKNFKSVSIITGDACELLPDDATVFFLFNPFKKHVVERFRDAVIEHYGCMNTLQDIQIIYYNDRHRDVFSADDRCMVEVLILPKEDFLYSGASVVTFKPHP